MFVIVRSPCFPEEAMFCRSRRISFAEAHLFCEMANRKIIRLDKYIFISGTS
jgi:hypothetical protein